MSWGTELWDQTDNVAVHMQKGIDFCEKFSHFIKERCMLENEYASKLKRLVKSYQPKKKDEDCEFSCVKGFQGMISEIYDMAGQHEVIAESLTATTQKNLQLLIQQVKNDRKKYMQDYAKQNNSLQTQCLQLDKIKKLYEKTFREAEKAREQFHKADADLYLSRAEVEKARTIMMQKQQACDNAKLDYAEELKKTNEFQKKHYYELVPDISQRFQDLEETRVNSMKVFYLDFIEIEKKVVPIISRCIEGMAKAVEGVSSAVDIRVIADRYKSGFIPPADIAFEDLNGSTTSTESPSPTGSVHSLNRVEAAKQKPVTPANNEKKKKKILGLFSSKQNDEPKEDFSHLPPSQQKKKLMQQINSIKSAISSETAKRDGLLKMQDVYRKNQSLGDPQSMTKQLEESAQKLDQLHADMQKFQTYLAEMDRSNTQIQESWSTSGSSMKPLLSNEASSPKINQQSQGLPDAQSESSFTNLELVVDKSNDRLSSGSVDSFEGAEEDNDVSTSSCSNSSALVGTCTALYPFTAENEGSLSMKEGEQFTILERDLGDGWIRVKNSDGVEGFVPSGYMECFWNKS